MHDFNNQLGTISNLAFVLGRVADDPAKVRELAGRLSELTQARTRVAERIRSFMRQDAQRFPDSNTVDLADIAREAMALAAAFAVARGNRGAVQLVADSLVSAPALGDGTELRAAAFELMLNAIEASAGGQIVRVSTSVADRRVILSVTDQGTGVREGIAETAFDPFISTKKEPDAGLGLSTVWGTARRHGGDVSLSVDAAQTTVATLWLPLLLERP